MLLAPAQFLATTTFCTHHDQDGLFPDVHFDVVVSGINRGDNASRHIVYSGTVAGAREAAFHGLVAVSCSLDSFSPDAVRGLLLY